MPDAPPQKRIDEAAKRLSRLQKQLKELRGGGGYAAHKDRAAGRQAEQSRAGREIGPLPKVKNPRRKKKCARTLERFLKLYFPEAFPLKWSADHRALIDKAQRVVLKGQLYAMAFPRGTGKTSIVERAALWAVLYGHRRYVFLIGATEKKALDLLLSIKIELETNERLYEDFPEACHPIRELERIANRVKGQLLDGVPTYMDWSKDRLCFPAQAGGAVIGVSGITGEGIRGSKYQAQDGRILRPDLVIIDDPQTRESARSPLQCRTREQLISADVLGMAGPGKSIAALMPCTVIAKGDVADKLLNRELHPQWQGDRRKLIVRWPERLDLWEEYGRILADDLKNDGDGSTATEFYGKHRKAMDKGAKVAWADRKLEGELSALEHAMRLWLRDAEAFASEYQNDPLDEIDPDEELLSVEDIAEKQSGTKRGQIPLEATKVTCFVDPDAKLLWWLIAAWSDDFSGVVVDYGAWPEQNRRYWSRRDARPTLAQMKPGAAREGQIYHALSELTGDLLGRRFTRPDGAELAIDRLIVDANWGEITDVVYKFCRECGYGSRVMPWHGKYVGAGSIPFSEYKKQPGETVGPHWRVPSTRRKRAARYVLADVNWWKSFVHARLATAQGDPGSLSLCGVKSPTHHRLIAEHLCAEYRVRTQAKSSGREVDEWKIRPDRPDNDLFDCLVGAAVGASMLGCELRPTGSNAGAPPKEKVKLSELREKKRRTS